MKQHKISIGLLIVLFLGWSGICVGKDFMHSRNLPSWRGGRGTPEDTIVGFVERVTDPSSPNFVPAPHRVAVLDMDGTILCERPYPVSMAMAIQGLVKSAESRPQLQENPLYRAALRQDRDYIRDHRMEILLTAFRDYTQEQYMREVQIFLTGTLHPKLGRP